MKTALVALGILVVLLVIAVAAMLFITFDSPGFGHAVMEEASAVTGLELHAERFRLNVSRGLMIEKFEARGTLAGEASLDAKLDRLVLTHRLWPLLSGTLAVEQIVLDHPDVTVTLATRAPPGRASPVTPSGPARPGGSAPKTIEASRGGLDVEIRSIRLADGTITATSGASRVTIEGLNLDLRDVGYEPKVGVVLRALSGTGALRVASARLGGLRLSDLRGTFALAGGRFRVPSIGLRVPEGPLQGEVAVDFNPSPFSYTFALNGEPMDVNQLVGTSPGGGGFGAGHLDVKGQGVGAASRGLVASGSVTLDKGTLPMHPVLTGILRALGKPVEAMPYERTTARFRVHDDRVDLAPVQFETPKLGLGLSGWASLAGPLALEAVVKTPRQGIQIQGVASRVLDVLGDERGWVAIPLTISGTLDAPKVRPDANALIRLAGSGAKRAVEEKGLEGLKRLLEKKR